MALSKEKQQEKLKLLEDAFSSYMMKKINRDKLEKLLQIHLNSLFSDRDKIFTVSLVENRKEPFFGFRIYPVIMNKVGDGTIIDRMVYNEKAPSLSSIVDHWKRIGEWYIEIDSNCFNRNELNFTPQELVAFLLHEIGHTIFYDSTIERFYLAYVDIRSRCSSAAKASQKFMLHLYALALVSSCGLHNLKVGKNEINVELFADSTLESLDYTQHLLSGLQKIIKAYGNSAFKDSNQQEAEIKNSIVWCNLNAQELITRKDKLKNELYYRMAKTDSGFIKRSILTVMNKLGINMKDRYTGSFVPGLESLLDMDNMSETLEKYSLNYDMNVIGVYERGIVNAQKTAMEGLFYNRNKKKELPSQLDLDSIAVEIDRITNHADRRYVLDLIYSQIEKIETFREQFEVNKELKSAYEMKTDRMLKELDDMRQLVLSKRNFDKEYKLFVKYPAGYEG